MKFSRACYFRYIRDLEKFAKFSCTRKFHAAEISCTRKFRASECAQIGLLLPRDHAAAKVIASYQMCMITGTSSPLLLSKVPKHV